MEKSSIGMYLLRAESDTSALSHGSDDFSESTSIRGGLQTWMVAAGSGQLCPSEHWFPWNRTKIYTMILVGGREKGQRTSCASILQ